MTRLQKLMPLLNRDGLNLAKKYMVQAKRPNILGFIVFLGKRKSPVETGISDKAFAKYYNHSISYI